MIVRYLEERISTPFDVNTPNWNSRRLLLKEDGVGFSLHDTIIKAGTETMIWYKHHIEAVYCIEGIGEIELIETKEIFPIRKGMLYVLNNHEKHLLRGTTEMRMLCVFNPPCTGHEVHDENGVYADYSQT